MEIGAKNSNELSAPWVHVFLYGASGSGKTTDAATFPKPLFILPKNEGSIVTLRSMNIPYFEVVDMSQTQLKEGVGSMNAIMDHIEAFYRRDPDNFPYDTIVVESLSHYADLVIEQLSSGGKKQMTQFEWGILTSNLRNIQTRLRNMDVHAVYTALERVDSVEDGTVVGLPLIPGQSSVKIPSSCDIIGYCEVIEGKNAQIYRVHFRKYRHYMARTRFREIPAKLENFTFAQIETFLK